MISARSNSSHETYPHSIVGELIYKVSGNALRIIGKDSLDFLQRLSTNNLSDIPMRSGRYTVLTTEKGRIVDLVLVNPLADKSLLLLSSSGQSGRVLSWLSKFVIMEDIKIVDVSPDVSVYLFIVSNENSGDNNTGAPITNDEIIISVRDPLWKSRRAYHLVKKGAALEDAALKSYGMKSITSEQLEELRITEGIPAGGRELTEDFNPLEAGLSSFISFTKGCYVGQEVIARIDTYKKLQKSLCGFWVDSPEQISISQAQEIFVGTQSAGILTSLQWSQHQQKCVALGYLNSGIHSRLFTLPHTNGMTYNVHRRDFPHEITNP